MSESPAKVAKIVDVNGATDAIVLAKKTEQLKKVVESALAYMRSTKEFLADMDADSPAGKKLLFAQESIFLAGQALSQGLFQDLCTVPRHKELAAEVLPAGLLESVQPWLKTFICFAEEEETGEEDEE